jgi:hypothetical protein
MRKLILFALKQASISSLFAQTADEKYSEDRWWIDGWTCEMKSDQHSFLNEFLAKE